MILLKILQESFRFAIQALFGNKLIEPDKIEFEEIGFDQKVIDSLKVMGHNVEQKGKIGKIKCIYYNSEGMIEGAADNRGDDTVLGY